VLRDTLFLYRVTEDVRTWPLIFAGGLFRPPKFPSRMLAGV
jgi:hypothetical protein